MKLFSKNRDWESAFKATPRFYSDAQGSIFGAFALTENTDTILPINPHKEFMVENKPVSVWKMIFVSTTEDSIISEMNYFDAIKRLEKFISQKNDNAILLKALSYNDMKSLVEFS